MVGLSAASGKAGAAIGVVAFGAIQDRLGEDVYGQRGVFLVGAAFSLLGALVTFICIPKVSLSLSQDEGFDSEFFFSLTKHRYFFINLSNQLSGNLEDEDYRFQQILADNNIIDESNEQVLEVSPQLNKG